MPRVYDLGGVDWQFGSVSRRPFDALNVDDRADVAKWLPATVPGNVRTDLLALERIPDPFFGDCYQASLWVEDCDWWYRRSLNISIEPDQRAFLIFDGVDYLSAVFFNGRELGRHEGMFSRQVYEVTDALRQTSETSGVSSTSVEIAVRLWGSGALPGRHLSLRERGWAWLVDRLDPSGIGAFPDRMATVKCQMSFGWDFAPPVRTMGVWDDVRLVVTGGVFIEDVWVKSYLPHPGSRLARLAVQATVDSKQPGPVQAKVKVCPANFDGPEWGPASFDLNLPPGRSSHTLTFDLPRPRLWQPWDRGFPHLYELTISLRLPAPNSQPPISDLQSLDSVSTRFGIRHIAFDGWTFTVNGRREFIRGLNWVPADSLPGRLRRENYADLLGMAQAAGANLLRVWGGGLREKRAFYDLCDELGLLVWQEFPFACSFLGYFPRDAGWLELVERECTAIVQAMRNHPSLALWCGGNEFSPRRNRPLAQRLSRVVETHDGDRPFLPTSPSPGDAHNWGVWHGKYPLHAYQREEARFLSEFGLQAAPSLETLRACLPEAELWPPGAGWERHKAEVGKLWRYVESTLSPNPSPYQGEGRQPPAPSPYEGEGKGPPAPSPYEGERKGPPAPSPYEGEGKGPPAPSPYEGEGKGPPAPSPYQGEGRRPQQAPSPYEGEGGIFTSLKTFIATSQRAQALGLQIAIEHMRRRKGETDGLCLWQFNEPWPAISWAIVDYWRRPKLAYERLKDLYNPVLVGLTFTPARYRPGDTLQAELWAVNDGLEALDDCRLLVDLDGARIYEKQVTLPPDSAQVVGMLRHQFQAEPGGLELVLHQGDRVIARNSYDLTYCDPTRAGWRERLVRWLADTLLR